MNLLNPSRPILIVEDEPDDVVLLKMALKRAEILHPIQTTADGQEAAEYLTADHKFQDRQAFPFPEMLIVDINMPRMNGLELLRWVKSQPECSVIPIIMFSSSQQEQDIYQAYLHGANAYIVKPSTLDELVRRMKLLFDFWAICAKPQVPEKCS